MVQEIRDCERTIEHLNSENESLGERVRYLEKDLLDSHYRIETLGK